MHKNIISCFVILLSVLSGFTASAQLIRLSENPENFADEMKTVMATDNNSYAIALSESFAKQWAERYTPEQKKQLMALSADMAKRGHKMPQYYLLLRLLDYELSEEANVSSAEFSNLLDVLQKTVAANSMQNASKIMEQLNEFVRTRIIYQSNFNKLYALNGSYTFRFIEKPTPYFSDVTNTATEQTEKSKDDAFDDWDSTEPDDGWSNNSAKTNSDLLKKTIELPAANGIVTDLKGVDLVIATQSDSAVVANVAAGVIWQTGKLVVKGGGMTWEAVGLPDVAAAFKEFSMDIMNPRFTAEDVTLTYADRLQTPISGVFEYKAGKREAGVPNTYPRFKSYEANAVIRNMVPNTTYQGGFSLMGNALLSSSVADQFSTIIVQKANDYHFKAVSRKFLLSDSLISADRAAFVAYVGEDSISHPGVQFAYNANQQTVHLSKLKQGVFKDSPYNDTFHEVDILCDAMKWDLTTQKMDFYIVSAKTEVPVLFESFNYYNPQRVRDLSGAAGFNPLLVVGNYVRKTRNYEFTVEDIGQSIGRPPEQVGGGLMTAAQQGLLVFNPTNRSFKLTPKGIHYLQAFAGQKDYDNLVISSYYQSSDSTTNSSLDLKSKALTIRGTKRFSLSEELGIFFLPYDDAMQFSKGRTFKADGHLVVKNYRFSGKEFEIDYDNFTVKLNKIDSISFTPKALYEAGGKEMVGSDIRFEHPATLYLNRPDNKAGKADLPEFPRLVMQDKVIVRFDESTRRKQKFNENVYFEVPKIDVDSLTTKDLALDGTFYSDNIFKPFKETLVVMPDNTLGFSHQVPNGKYPVYGDKSSVDFDADLQLDNRGLHSSGKVNHLAAGLTAKEIRFFTDSLLATGETGEIKETTAGTYFPQVAVSDYTLRWIPAADSMLISSKKGFEFYAGTSTLTGELLVREKGLFGLGTLARTDSETQSDEFKFNEPGFIADHAVFKIKSEAAKSKPILLGKNVNVDFHVKDNFAEIAVNEKDFNDTTTSAVEFPLAAYQTTIGKARWDIAKKQVSMQGDVENSVFTSTNPEQEGLAFNGSTAVYDIPGMTLNIEGVPYIVSADARILPEGGKVSIQRNAQMQAFTNARLTIDTLNGYHNLINGNIQILSKKRFKGDATYQFVNVSADTFKIKMGNFELKDLLAASRGRNDKPTLSTVANATVSVKDSLFLSPKMLYKGTIAMLAPQKNLSLDGFIIPELKKYPQLGGSWLTYKGDKSEEITINVDENLRTGDDRAYAGLHVKANSGTDGLYPTFLSTKKSPDDDDIFVATGVFRRDEPNKRFVITPDGDKSGGNRYELLDDEGVIRTEGTYNLLGGKISRYLSAGGMGEMALDSNQYAFDLMMLYEFPLPPPVALAMGDNIIKTNLDLGNSEPAILFESDAFSQKLAQFLNEKDAKAYRDQLYRGHVPMFKFSPKFATTMVISDVQMKWNPFINSFYSVGKIGVSNIGESDINAMIPGYLEIIKNPVAGDEVYLFLEVSDEVWYYMGYKNGEMAVVSSDDNFNKLITAKDKADKGKDYNVISVDFAEPMTFRRHFLTTYLGVKADQLSKKPADPKKLSQTPEQKEKKEEKKKATEAEGF